MNKIMCHVNYSHLTLNNILCETLSIVVSHIIMIYNCYLLLDCAILFDLKVIDSHQMKS